MPLKVIYQNNTQKMSRKTKKKQSAIEKPSATFVKSFYTGLLNNRNLYQ